MTRDELLALADRVESAVGRPDRTMNREVALAAGWHRRTPSESRKSYPTWIHPDDCRDGKPVFDSLHGTDVWREPLDYLGSIDAAMTLVPKGWRILTINEQVFDDLRPWVVRLSERDASFGRARQADAISATPALALTAAALRARAAMEAEVCGG